MPDKETNPKNEEPRPVRDPNMIKEGEETTLRKIILEIDSLSQKIRKNGS